MHITCDDCFTKIGTLEDRVIRLTISGKGASCVYCREWLTGEAVKRAHVVEGEPAIENILKLRGCQAEDQGGWPCNSRPVVFQLTADEVKKNQGQQAYYCSAHRTSRHVWHESETELIPAPDTLRSGG